MVSYLPKAEVLDFEVDETRRSGIHFFDGESCAVSIHFSSSEQLLPTQGRCKSTHKETYNQCPGPSLYVKPLMGPAINNEGIASRTLKAIKMQVGLLQNE